MSVRLDDIGHHGIEEPAEPVPTPRIRAIFGRRLVLGLKRPPITSHRSNVHRTIHPLHDQLTGFLDPVGRYLGVHDERKLTDVPH